MPRALSLTHSAAAPTARPACAGTSACAGTCPLVAAGVDRRTFLSHAMLAAAAAALAACGGGGSDAPTAPSSVAGTLRVADYPALASTGGIALASVGGASLAIVRTGASSFVALSRVCPHQGNIVNVSGAGFLCPGHGARFDATGRWTGGQSTTNLRAYPAAYDAAAGTLAIG